MITFKSQYILLLVILLLTFLGPILGILQLAGIGLPIAVLKVLMPVFGYMPLVTALLGVFAVYRQVKIFKQESTKTDKLNLMLTSLLLLPALYTLLTVILMWSVALMI